MPVEKIISGGQTGVDQIGLRVGRLLGLKTGGTAPKGWRTETGSCPQLAEYGLIESFSDDYTVRTEDNVVEGDATILFGNLSSAGSKCTLRAIRKYKKNYIANPTLEQLLAFLNRVNPAIINIAGNRGSHILKADRDRYGKTLLEAVKLHNEQCTT